MRFLPLIVILLLCACRNGQDASLNEGGKMEHATLLQIEQSDSFCLVAVANPWARDEAPTRYVLVPRDSILPRQLPEGVLLRTPLRRSIAFSTVHAALLQKLGVSEAMLGLCDTQYIIGDSLKKTVANGQLADFGSSVQPDIEAIIAAQSDGLLVSPIENAGYGLIEKTGVPLIVCADYMETTALGRAEWMRFFGLLYGCEERADSLFRIVRANYQQLTQLAASAGTQATVLCDLKEGAAWYVPGGRSTWAELFRDAKVNYALDENTASGSAALDFEQVFATMGNADFWMMKYGRSTNFSYEDLAADYAPYCRLRPWRERRIFGCNTFAVPYYEEAPFRPDFLLHDIIKMAHPDLLANEAFYFYSPL